MLKAEILKMINLIDTAMQDESDPYKGEIWAELFMEKIKQYPVDVQVPEGTPPDEAWLYKVPSIKAEITQLKKEEGIQDEMVNVDQILPVPKSSFKVFKDNNQNMEMDFRKMSFLDKSEILFGFKSQKSQFFGQSIADLVQDGFMEGNTFKSINENWMNDKEQPKRMTLIDNNYE